MGIDWGLVATIAAPLVALVVGSFLTRRPVVNDVPQVMCHLIAWTLSPRTHLTTCSRIRDALKVIPGASYGDQPP